MKRISFLLVVSLLIGCGGGGSSDPGTNNQLPIVTTTASSSITVNSATANGSVNPNGNATNAYFEWGTDSTLATHTDTDNQSVGSGVASVSVNTALTGLSTGTTYYYRVCGVSSTGTSTGSIVSFTTGTPAAPPTVQTLAATGIALTGATLNGQVNPNGITTSGRFRWGYSSTTLTNLTSWVALGAGATSVSISFDLTGQSPGTPIYYQAEGDSSSGNTLGAVVNFTTLVPSMPPTVATLGATNISQNSGTLNGQVNPNGVASNGRFRWGYSSTTLTNMTPWLALGSGTTNVAISFDLIGQSPGTPIYYQAEGDSSAGNTLGAVANFTTSLLSNMATITFDSISNGDSVIIFCNNNEVHNFYNDTGTNATTSYVGPAGSANKYKFIRIIGTQTAVGFPISIVDVNDNNVFQLNTGGQLTVQYQLSSAIGRAQYYITGTGFAASYQAPGNVSGNWNTHSVVDNSTNGNVPVGTTQDALVTCVQNEFQVLKVLSGLGTVYGTTNGDLVFFWFWGGTDPLWLQTWQDTWLINSASTAFTGDGMETWQARSGPDFFYTHWNATGTR